MRGIGRYIRLLTGAAAHPKVARMGMREFRDGCGWTFDGDAESPRSVAYDCGRELAHIATARFWDDCASPRVFRAWERVLTWKQRIQG